VRGSYPPEAIYIQKNDQVLEGGCKRSLSSPKWRYCNSHFGRWCCGLKVLLLSAGWALQREERQAYQGCGGAASGAEGRARSSSGGGRAALLHLAAHAHALG